MIRHGTTEICSSVFQRLSGADIAAITACRGRQYLQKSKPLATTSDRTRFVSAFILGEGRHEPQPERTAIVLVRRRVARTPIRNVGWDQIDQRLPMPLERRQRSAVPKNMARLMRPSCARHIAGARGRTHPVKWRDILRSGISRRDKNGSNQEQQTQSKHARKYARFLPVLSRQSLRADIGSVAALATICTPDAHWYGHRTTWPKLTTYKA